MAERGPTSSCTRRRRGRWWAIVPLLLGVWLLSAVHGLAGSPLASWQGPDGRQYLGRWPDGVVPWFYNPAGAPPELADTGRVTGLLREAMRQWEGVCGVRFTFLGETDVPVWKTVPGAVVVGWGGGRGDGAAAEAGPAWSSTPARIEAEGYLPFTDGRVRLARLFAWDGGGGDGYADAMTLAVLTHELGHVIGLGHSEDPWAVMAATPYTNLLYPRADDAAMARLLYGPPASPLHIPRHEPPQWGETRAVLHFARENDPETPLERLAPAAEQGREPVCLRFVLADAPAGEIEVVLADPSGVFHSGRALRHPGGTARGLACLLAADAMASLGPTWRASLSLNGRLAGEARLATQGRSQTLR